MCADAAQGVDGHGGGGAVVDDEGGAGGGGVVGAGDAEREVGGVGACFGADFDGAARVGFEGFVAGGELGEDEGVGG